MNKASAVGFGVGVVFLGLVMAVIGVGNAQKRPQVAGKPVAVAGEGRASANEESAEVDAGAKALEKKLPEFKTAGSEASAIAGPQGGGMKMSRVAAPGGYRTGQALDVMVSLACEGKEKVTALALVERLPKGWSFQEVSGGAKPVIAPTKGVGGELTFVWVQVPAFPCTVSYRVVAGTEVAGAQEFQGQAVYRQAGPEQRTEMVKTVVAPAT